MRKVSNIPAIFHTLQCVKCQRFDLIKISSGNKIASYTCDICRNSSPGKNPANLFRKQKTHRGEFKFRH